MYPFELWAEQNLAIYARNGVEFKIQCLNPKHEDSHPSAYFNVEKGAWFCHSCGGRGSIADNPEFNSVEFQVRSARGRLNKLLEPEPEKTYADDAMLKRYNLPTKYWAGRGLTPETVEFFELGYDAIADAVTIPTRDINGRLLGVTRRFIASDHIGPRYKYPKGFKASQNLFAAWLYDEYDMSVVSVHEGAIDAMRLWQLNIPATALYGSNISSEHVQLLLQMGVKKIVYFGDSDNAGQRSKQRAKGYWVQSDDSYQYKKETDLSKHFSLFHVTDYQGHKDAGAMTDDQILAAWSSQEPFLFHGRTQKKKYTINPRMRMQL